MVPPPLASGQPKLNDALTTPASNGVSRRKQSKSRNGMFFANFAHNSLSTRDLNV
jgi:hypothetical protein